MVSQVGSMHNLINREFANAQRSKFILAQHTEPEACAINDVISIDNLVCREYPGSLRSAKLSKKERQVDSIAAGSVSGDKRR